MERKKTKKQPPTHPNKTKTGKQKTQATVNYTAQKHRERKNEPPQRTGRTESRYKYNKTK